MGKTVAYNSPGYYKVLPIFLELFQREVITNIQLTHSQSFAIGKQANALKIILKVSLMTLESFDDLFVVCTNTAVSINLIHFGII